MRSLVATLIMLAAIAPAQQRPGGQPRRPLAVTARGPAGGAPGDTGPRRAGEFRIEMLIAPPAGTQVLELWVAAPRNDHSQTVHGGLRAVASRHD